MIDHAWSVFCARSFTDPESRNPTLIDVVHQLNLRRGIEFPAVVPMQSDLVSMWYRSDPRQAERGSGRITLVKPGEAEGEPIEFDIDLTEFVRGMTTARSGSIELSGPGRYFFRIEVKTEGEQNWRTVARLPLDVDVHEKLPGPGQ